MTAIEVLRKYQKQLDPEGIEVGVSRQALDEVLDTIESLQARVAELEAAEERSAEYLAESVENEVEALEKIKRLDAALAEIASLADAAPIAGDYETLFIEAVRIARRTGE
jgi:hypothetical protein